MTGMMDATCPKCGKRSGWFGRAADRPACPRCKYQVPAAELADTDAKLDEMRRLFDLHPKDATPAELARQRELAGLTRGQVAKLLGVEPPYVLIWESGGGKPDPAVLDKMAELYGCG